MTAIEDILHVGQPLLKISNLNEVVIQSLYILALSYLTYCLATAVYRSEFSPITTSCYCETAN